jgi:type II secretory pathway pseudopilin PulG
MSRHHTPMARRENGYSLVELLVSVTVLLTVVGSVFVLIDPSQSMSKAQPEVADMQQRMRVAADMIHKDLLMAGAGTYSGAIAGGLANFFPPILPYKAGALSPDPELSYFDDRITIVYVPDTASQTNVRERMPQPSSEIKVTAEPGCPVDDALCGFDVGMRVVIFDDTGSYDVFTITAVQTESLHLQHRPPNPDFSKAYRPEENARIAQVANAVYFLDRTNAVLHHYDGFTDDVPLVDNTVDMRFTYYGDPLPAMAPRPASGQANCIFDAAGNTKMATLPTSGSSLVELTRELLTTGEVCGVAPNRFDADLYRVRKVRVELRMQVGHADLRGPNPAGQDLFLRPGTSTNAYRSVPDFTMEFEVAPRNLNLLR